MLFKRYVGHVWDEHADSSQSMFGLQRSSDNFKVQAVRHMYGQRTRQCQDRPSNVRTKTESRLDSGTDQDARSRLSSNSLNSQNDLFPSAPPTKLRKGQWNEKISLTQFYIFPSTSFHLLLVFPFGKRVSEATTTSVTTKFSLYIFLTRSSLCNYRNILGKRNTVEPSSTAPALKACL